MVFSDYRVSPNFLVVLGLRLWLRLGLDCDNIVAQAIQLYSEYNGPPFKILTETYHVLNFKPKKNH